MKKSSLLPVLIPTSEELRRASSVNPKLEELITVLEEKTEQTGN